MKIVTVIGARPQLIKAAAVSRAIQSFSKSRQRIQEIIVHTGQHYDYLMDRVFFEELHIPKPNYHLGVGSGSHGRQTGMMLDRVETILSQEDPDRVVVYGDTNTTLAGALAAAKLGIPIVHVESGLRSYVRTMPEEINRVLTDHLSTFLFCPTSQAVRNLAQEGIRSGQGRVVKNVGDVMYDSILYYSKIAEQKSTILKDLGVLNPESLHGGQRGAIPKPQYYLVTLHRAENTDDPKKLKSILKALNEIGKETPVILPLHPRTRKMIQTFRLLPQSRNLRLIDPVSYFDMLKLEKNAKAILTDSGGVQKEAYWFKVPCLTLRDETEWVETVRSGWNRLVGTETKTILDCLKSGERKIPSRWPRFFGDGKSSSRIVQLIWDLSKGDGGGRGME